MVNKPKDVQEFDGYPMPNPDEIKKLPEEEMEKLIKETLERVKELQKNRP